MTAVVETRPTPVRGRDRYIDTLRAVALIRVMTFHTVGWLWLPFIFPSMGVMFALAGSLVAVSLDRAVARGEGAGHYRVIAKRLKRLLPPFWVFGASMVAIMLVAGWEDFSWHALLPYLLPLTTPTGSELGTDWVVPLWYIRSYFWFLLASPILLWCFRNWPKRTMSVPLVIVLIDALGFADYRATGSGDAFLTFGIFGACWLLGFAHHDGLIRKLKWQLVVGVGVALMALGTLYLLTHPDSDAGYSLDDVPLADALYCFGFAAILLRLYPDFSWMAKHHVLDTIVSAFNSRAMTIYLWGNVAIFCATPILDRSFLASYYTDDARGMLLQYLTSWGVILVAVLALGWIEDVAGGRKPRLLPVSLRRVKSAPRNAARVATTPGEALLEEIETRAARGGNDPLIAAGSELHNKVNGS